MRGAALPIASALAVLAGGALHLRLALQDYGTSDLITLFLMNALASAVVAAWLVYDRRPFPLLAGLAISGVSLLAFGLSRVGDGVVGFRGSGLEPGPDSALTLLAEGVAASLLAVRLFQVRRELAAVVRVLPLPRWPERTRIAGTDPTTLVDG